jgi:hypothetical protein
MAIVGLNMKKKLLVLGCIWKVEIKKPPLAKTLATSACSLSQL